MIFSCAVSPQIYLPCNVSVLGGKELNSNVDKTCAEKQRREKESWKCVILSNLYICSMNFWYLVFIINVWDMYREVYISFVSKCLK